MPGSASNTSVIATPTGSRNTCRSVRMRSSEPETVTKRSPAPEGENWASESDWGAEGWEAPEAGLEPVTRSLSQPGEPPSDGAVEATAGPEVPPVERPTSE